MGPSLHGKTLFITGASRGIGKAIALRAARDGACVAIAAKTAAPHRRLPGTIHSTAADIEAAGGHALPLQVDIRDERQIGAAIEATVGTFGGVDIVVNNAGSLSLTGTLATPMRRFDRMFGVNVRGAYATAQAAIPYLCRAANPHILNIAPPLNLDPRWFKNHAAYTISKYGMSMCVLGMAAELAPDRIAVNALWPRTVVATAALALLDGIDPEQCRKPEIMADAAHVILTRDSTSYTGNLAIDEEVLASIGVVDFSSYAVRPGARLRPDIFLD